MHVGEKFTLSYGWTWLREVMVTRGTSPANILVVYGNLTADPQLEHMSNGTPVVNFHVAEEHSRGTNYFKCVLVGERAEAFVQQYKKGDHLCVTGRMMSNTRPGAEGDVVWWQVWVTSAGYSGIFG